MEIHFKFQNKAVLKANPNLSVNSVPVSISHRQSLFGGLSTLSGCLRWLWVVSFASAARSILETSARVLTPIFTCCYSKATRRWQRQTQQTYIFLIIRKTLVYVAFFRQWRLCASVKVNNINDQWKCQQVEELQTDIQVVYSDFTAAAQYGLHLSVNHKPFRAATASPENHSWSLCFIHFMLHPLSSILWTSSPNHISIDILISYHVST